MQKPPFSTTQSILELTSNHLRNDITCNILATNNISGVTLLKLKCSS